MAVELAGMARLTHVPSPLTRMGDLCSEADETRRLHQRMKAIESVALSSGLGLLLIVSLLTFGPLLNELLRSDGNHYRAGLGVKPSWAATQEIRADTAKAMTVALKRKPMRQNVEPLRPVHASAEDVLPVMPVMDELGPANTHSDVVASVPSALLTGLPPGSQASKGREVAPGEWAFDLSDFDGVKVSLPEGTREQVRANIELMADGEPPQSFGFAIKPGRAVRLARNPAGLVEGRAVSAEAKSKAKVAQQPSARAQNSKTKVSKGMSNPSGLGMGNRKRQPRPRDYEAYPPEPAGPAPSFGGFLGLF